mmetsp:Transcript_111659/g.312086  ORF Transcript_111659/g.312086 Transcript_111659/m.312086 type:complete len:224 (-) Transcript_111659:56-727(-)
MLSDVKLSLGIAGGTEAHGWLADSPPWPNAEALSHKSRFSAQSRAFSEKRSTSCRAEAKEWAWRRHPLGVAMDAPCSNALSKDSDHTGSPSWAATTLLLVHSQSSVAPGESADEAGWAATAQQGRARTPPEAFECLGASPTSSGSRPARPAAKPQNAESDHARRRGTAQEPPARASSSRTSTKVRLTTTRPCALPVKAASMVRREDSLNFGVAEAHLLHSASG